MTRSEEAAVDFGITAIGSALGRRTRIADAVLDYTDDLRRIKAWGFRSFHVADPEVGLTDLAVEAGRRALDKAGIPATGIDALVLCTAGPAEYLYWDAAAAVQSRIAATAADVLLVSHACASGVMAFDLVAGKLATHPEYRNVLLIAANRVCEAYFNRMDSNTSVFSDGAAAAVVTRGADRCTWLATETLSDGSLADLLRLEKGGAALPWGPSAEPPVPVLSAVGRLSRFYQQDQVLMREFGELTVQRTKEVVHRACKRAGVDASSIARLIHLNDNIFAISAAAEALGIPMSRTNADIAMDLGHVGAADQLLTLDLHLSQGAVGPGDLVALTAVGSGMHWSCTLLRI